MCKMINVSIASSLLLNFISHLLTRNQVRVQLLPTLFAATGAGIFWATNWSRKTVPSFADDNDNLQKTCRHITRNDLFCLFREVDILFSNQRKIYKLLCISLIIISLHSYSW